MTGKRKVGRPPVGDRRMTRAEASARHREKAKARKRLAQAAGIASQEDVDALFALLKAGPPEVERFVGQIVATLRQAAAASEVFEAKAAGAVLECYYSALRHAGCDHGDALAFIAPGAGTDANAAALAALDAVYAERFAWAERVAALPAGWATGGGDGL